MNDLSRVFGDNDLENGTRFCHISLSVVAESRGLSTHGRSQSSGENSSGDNDREELFRILIPIWVPPLRELEKEEEVCSEESSLSRTKRKREYNLREK